MHVMVMPGHDINHPRRLHPHHLTAEGRALVDEWAENDPDTAYRHWQDWERRFLESLPSASADRAKLRENVHTVSREIWHPVS